jgi:hypothetical protein
MSPGSHFSLFAHSFDSLADAPICRTKFGIFVHYSLQLVKNISADFVDVFQVSLLVGVKLSF